MRSSPRVGTGGGCRDASRPAARHVAGCERRGSRARPRDTVAGLRGDGGLDRGGDRTFRSRARAVSRGARRRIHAQAGLRAPRGLAAERADSLALRAGLLRRRALRAPGRREQQLPHGRGGAAGARSPRRWRGASHSRGTRGGGSGAALHRGDSRRRVRRAAALRRRAAGPGLRRAHGVALSRRRGTRGPRCDRCGGPRAGAADRARDADPARAPRRHAPSRSSRWGRARRTPYGGCSRTRNTRSRRRVSGRAPRARTSFSIGEPRPLFRRSTRASSNGALTGARFARAYRARACSSSWRAPGSWGTSSTSFSAKRIASFRLRRSR